MFLHITIHIVSFKSFLTTIEAILINLLSILISNGFFKYPFDS